MKGTEQESRLSSWRLGVAALAVLSTLGASECSTPQRTDVPPAGPGTVRSDDVEQPQAATGLPVFPGAEGFGTRTRAGRGGRVAVITSLADSGPGTLREALTDSAPKTIVFRTGGVIQLRSHLFISHPYVTIAGQTAPGDGIVIADFGLVITAHDVLVQSIRVRPGDRGQVRPDHNDAIAILGPTGDSAGARNVVIDHVSVSWGEDELISTWFGPADVTVSWSIIGEGLSRSRHAKQTHSAGLLVGDRSDRVSIHHNLLAHNDFRNPLVMSGGTHEVVNNVVYNWGALPTEVVDDAPISVNVIGNYYRIGPSARTPHAILINPNEKAASTRIFAAGNQLHGSAEPADPWTLVQYGWKGRGAPARFRSAAPFPSAIGAAHTALEAYALVLDGAGAARPKRDAVDNRIVASVRAGSGRIIDSPDEVGGLPSYARGVAPADADSDGLPDEWEVRAMLDPNNAADGAMDADGDGYSNLEEYLHALMSERTEQGSLPRR